MKYQQNPADRIIKFLIIVIIGVLLIFGAKNAMKTSNGEADREVCQAKGGHYANGHCR